MLSSSQLITLINNTVIDNTSGLINAYDLRGVLTEMVSSDANLITNNNLLGLGEFDTTFTYSSGACCVYNNIIYKCIAGSSTVSLFVTTEWVQISSYFASTSGLNIYAEKQNTIELDNNKLIKTIDTDTSFINSIQTGLYKVEAVTASTGLSEDYPLAGKGFVFANKRTAQAESIYFYYPYSDLTHYYIRLGNGTWNEFKSTSTDLTYSNGLTKFGNDVQANGDFTTIELTGDSYTINADSLITLNAPTAITGDIFHTGNYRIGTTPVNITGNSTDNIISGNLKLNGVGGISQVATTKLLTVDSVTRKVDFIDIDAIGGGGSSLSGTNGIVIDNNEIKIDDNNLTIESNYTTFNTTNTYEANANIFRVNSNSWIYLNSVAPAEIYSDANVKLYSPGPVTLNSTGSVIQLITDNAPVIVTTTDAIRYQYDTTPINSTDSSTDLVVPHKKWVKDFVSANISYTDVNSYYLQSSSGAYFQITDTAYFDTNQVYLAGATSVSIEAPSTNIFTDTFGLYINPADAQTVIINETDFIVKAPNSITYDADYSSNFTDRSLVDKAYVDSVAGGSVDFSSVVVPVISLTGSDSADLNSDSYVNLNSGSDININSVNDTWLFAQNDINVNAVNNIKINSNLGGSLTTTVNGGGSVNTVVGDTVFSLSNSDGFTAVSSSSGGVYIAGYGFCTIHGDAHVQIEALHDMTIAATLGVEIYSGERVKINQVLNLKPMTTTTRNTLTASKGDVVFNSTTNKLNVYTGSAWEAITSA